MRKPPKDLQPYRTTPRFSAETVPLALTRIHRTKSGVWGRIEVLEGTLGLTRFDGSGEVAAPEESILAGQTALVRPCEPHFVTLGSDTVFQVTFLSERGAVKTQERA